MNTDIQNPLNADVTESRASSHPGCIYSSIYFKPKVLGTEIKQTDKLIKEIRETEQNSSK